MHSSGLDPRPDIAKWSKATFRYIVWHSRRDSALQGAAHAQRDSRANAATDSVRLRHVGRMTS